MKKAIIIDDEKLIREGLVTYIDWTGLDIEICATCQNGPEGISAALRHRPHLILADICLPGMDGITMLEKLRSYSLGCEVIFISSYSEFQYAQKAVQLGAFDYLLKPLEADVLHQSVKKCMKKIENKSPEPLPCDRPLLERVFKEALTSSPHAGQTFFTMAGQYGIPKCLSACLLIAASPEDPLENPIPAITEKLAKLDFVWDFFFTPVSPRVSCFCIFTAPEQEELICRQLFHCQIDDHDCYYQQILPIHKEAYEKEENIRPLSDPLQTAFYRGLLTLLTQYFPPPPVPGPYWNEAKQELAPAVIESLNYVQLKAAFHQFILFCASHHWMKSHGDFRFECAAFLENIYRQLERYYAAPLPKSIDMHLYLERLNEPRNLWDLAFTLYRIISEMFAQLHQKAIRSPYTRAALQLIQNKYQEPLSLKSVAQQLNISASYFSTVFKEDTGCPFSDYLFQYRMKMALELIKNKNLKVYEIGCMTGYPDVAQFSKSFKKYWGYSPKQIQRSSLIPK